MAHIELLKHNLAIESDLQNFVGFILTTVKNLGGNAFAATTTTLEIAKRLRTAGAGSGYPLPAELRLNECALSVRWNDLDELPVVNLPVLPTDAVVAEVCTYLQQSTEINDPDPAVYLCAGYEDKQALIPVLNLLVIHGESNLQLSLQTSAYTARQETPWR